RLRSGPCRPASSCTAGPDAAPMCRRPARPAGRLTVLSRPDRSHRPPRRVHGVTRSLAQPAALRGPCRSSVGSGCDRALRADHTFGAELGAPPLPLSPAPPNDLDEADRREWSDAPAIRRRSGTACWSRTVCWSDALHAGDLDEVAAGVIEDGGGHAVHRQRLLSERHAALAQAGV